MEACNETHAHGMMCVCAARGVCVLCVGVLARGVSAKFETITAIAESNSNNRYCGHDPVKAFYVPAKPGCSGVMGF